MSNGPNGIRLEGDVDRGPLVEILIDGHTVKAYAGETIAAALMCDGRWTCQSRDGRPLGVFCNVGVCHGCVMKVNGVSGVRTCKTLVTDGCRVETQSYTKGAVE